MSDIKPTKTALRQEQDKLRQLQKYLPTLELKKSLLALEVHNIEGMLNHAHKVAEDAKKEALSVVNLLDDSSYKEFFKIDHCEIVTENIAGVEVPFCKEVLFKEPNYSIMQTPFFLEHIVAKVRHWLSLLKQIEFIVLKKERLEAEYRTVSIRVNLFKKRLIPDARENVKKVSLFLDEQALAEVVRSKFIKDNILKR